MSERKNINVDYTRIEYQGTVYFVGEEDVLDANQDVIGWIAQRGNEAIVSALDPGTGDQVGRMIVRSTAPDGVFQTETDVIRAVNFLHHGTFK